MFVLQEKGNVLPHRHDMGAPRHCGAWSPSGVCGAGLVTTEATSFDTVTNTRDTLRQRKTTHHFGNLHVESLEAFLGVTKKQAKTRSMGIL